LSNREELKGKNQYWCERSRLILIKQQVLSW